MDKEYLEQLIQSDKAIEFQLSLHKTVMPVEKINNRNPNLSISEWYNRLNTRAESKLKQWLQLLSIQPACKTACPHCCYQAIVINKFEKRALVGYLQEANKLDLLIHNFEKINSQLRLINKLKFDINNEQDISKLRSLWFLEKIPCPLLYEKKCIAYPVRPMSCISYINFGFANACQIDYDIKLGYKAEWLEYWLILQIRNYVTLNKNKLNINELFYEDLLTSLLQELK